MCEGEVDRFKGPTPEKPKTSEDLYMDVRSNANTSISFGFCAIVVNDPVQSESISTTHTALKLNAPPHTPHNYLQEAQTAIGIHLVSTRRHTHKL